jgi:hypothetical protein
MEYVIDLGVVVKEISIGRKTHLLVLLFQAWSSTAIIDANDNGILLVPEKGVVVQIR